MKRYSSTARRAATTAALLAMAGLVLAGCKSSTSSSSASSVSPGASASGGSGSSGSASTPGGSGGSTSGSSSTLFPVAVGNTWVYETTGLGSNSTLTNKMIKVVPVAAGKKVTMKVTTSLPAAAGKATTLVYLFNNDGSITVPFAQVGGATAKVLSGKVVWPGSAQLASGQPFTSHMVLSLNLAGHSIHASAHVTVQGHGTQTVTVPAGTYHAQIINETIREKVEGATITLRVVNWVANGVGPVKQELRTAGGSASIPSIVEKLKSFTQG